jgi:transposase
MYSVDLYSRVRRACHVDGMSKSAAARLFGINRKTVSKMLEHSVPPGYRRNGPPVRPKLDPFIPIIDRILEEDKSLLKKQRHTAKRIFERLRDEYGFTGGITIVTDYVREKKRRTREVFVPLAHAPGHAQVDFGEALGEIGGVVCKLHYFAMALPHSDALFIKAYPGETTEAFCDGHVSAFAFFGGVPLSMLYDNTTIAVARILGDGTRKRTRAFSELQSHYLFEDRFGRPGKGNDKGHVEGVIGLGRRNYMVPMPRFESFEALNAWLEEQCLKRQDEVLRGHSETIGERLMRDLDALMVLPAAPYDACEKVSTRATSISMVRYRCNDYSVPVAYAHHEVPAVLREGRHGLRSDALPAAAGAEGRRPRPGRTAAGLGAARCLRHPAPAAGSADGKERQARVCPGPAAARDLRDGPCPWCCRSSTRSRRHRL